MFWSKVDLKIEGPLNMEPWFIWLNCITVIAEILNAVIYTVFWIYFYCIVTSYLPLMDGSVVLKVRTISAINIVLHNNR